jgi:GNAT superfamily N-acetyltransferase
LTGDAFIIGPLSNKHDRSSFTCGVGALDQYFRRQASQDIRRRIAGCFVICEAATGVIAGYYTLSATILRLDELPEAMASRLLRYPAVPAVLVGRLAVAAAYQGRKLGAVLLGDAVMRAAAADIAAFAIVVDPKDDGARRFYRHYGFIELPQPERRMFIPIETALRYFRSRGEVGRGSADR